MTGPGVICRATAAIGRAAIGLPFLVLGWGAASKPGKRVDLAAALGVPQPELAVRVNGAAMVAAGMCIGTGRKLGPAGLGLATSLVPTTLAAHQFWTMSDPAERAANRIHFYKNVGLLGAALVVSTMDRPSD